MSKQELTATQSAKQFGVAGLKEVTDTAGVPSSTLKRWYTDKPKLFAAVCIGVATINKASTDAQQ